MLYLGGKCYHKPAFEQCEYSQLKARLQISPDGSDKIDELEEAMGYLQDERDKLKEENSALKAFKEYFDELYGKGQEVVPQTNIVQERLKHHHRS